MRLSCARPSTWCASPHAANAFHQKIFKSVNSYLSDQAELALASDETPVGCVFVHDGKIIAKGMNGTNVTMNVSKHIKTSFHSAFRPTEYPRHFNNTCSNSIAILLSPHRDLHLTCLPSKGTRHAEFVALSQILAEHKPDILQETDLYVTVEPCIMCASVLRQFRIRAVYFGCLNDRFGGCGGVMRICDE